MTITRKEMRRRVRHFNAERRQEQVMFIKRDLRRLSMIAHVESDRLPMDAKEALESLALPEDYSRIIDHIGTCSPKTRRIARNCLIMWNDMDSRKYMEILRNTFFQENGCLKKTSIDDMFAEFHEALLEEKRKIKKEQKQWIPWSKAKNRLFGG
jgi:hypothetical protein